MEGESPERGEERKLIRLLREKEEKEDSTEDDFKMEAISEVAYASNQLAQFYEGLGNTQKAREHYNKAIDKYETAIAMATKYGSLSSKQIYSKECKSTEKDLEKLEETAQTSPIEKAILATSLILVFVSFIFFVPKITGNTIANLTTETTSMLGAGLLISGILLGALWFKIKDKD